MQAAALSAWLLQVLATDQCLACCCVKSWVFVRLCMQFNLPACPLMLLCASAVEVPAARGRVTCDGANGASGRCTPPFSALCMLAYLSSRGPSGRCELPVVLDLQAARGHPYCCGAMLSVCRRPGTRCSGRQWDGMLITSSQLRWVLMGSTNLNPDHNPESFLTLNPESAPTYADCLCRSMIGLQEMLPAKPVFFRYVAVLCGINAGAAVGACLLGLHVQLGYCLYGLAELLYNALLPPVRTRSQSSQHLSVRQQRSVGSGVTG